MVLSNLGNQYMSTDCRDCSGAGVHDPQAHGGGLVLCAHVLTTNICVTVDSKVVVGRRLHHRTGVHRPRPQGQISPLWPQWSAAWPLVPHSRTLERPTLGSVRSF